MGHKGPEMPASEQPPGCQAAGLPPDGRAGPPSRFPLPLPPALISAIAQAPETAQSLPGGCGPVWSFKV